jgi:hypothetical protein
MALVFSKVDVMKKHMLTINSREKCLLSLVCAKSKEVTCKWQHKILHNILIQSVLTRKLIRCREKAFGNIFQRLPTILIQCWTNRKNPGFHYLYNILKLRLTKGSINTVCPHIMEGICFKNVSISWHSIMQVIFFHWVDCYKRRSITTFFFQSIVAIIILFYPSEIIVYIQKTSWIMVIHNLE